MNQIDELRLCKTLNLLVCQVSCHLTLMVLRSIVCELVDFPGLQAPDLLAVSAATLAALSREQYCASQ